MAGNKEDNTKSIPPTERNKVKNLLVLLEDRSNLAVVLYHVHEYAHALFLLVTLYQNIEPIDERIALHVCLLLLDVALACRDASKAADVIQHLEIFFGACHALGQGDSGSNIQPQSKQGLKFSGINNIPASNACSTDFSGSVNAQESALTRTLSDETLEFETSCSTLDTGTYNLERPTTNGNSKLAAVASAVDLKLNLHLYKVRQLLLTWNLKVAMREIKLAMNISCFGYSSVSLLLKSQLEYARGNHRKAIKLLITSSNRKEEDDANKATSASAKNLNHKNILVADSKASNATSASIPASNGDSKETKTGQSCVHGPVAEWFATAGTRFEVAPNRVGRDVARITKRNARRDRDSW
ncbi:hypothetical protein C4D60_Mb11t06230 [Musa balbisiana]|uniref:Uncharacterized protein n=1 Tax=Musa balbisiana TaxID=52838 RepID=A0A4S8J238_MUSBA|nr:hypothetical protein C4D60_Mb11t06230 [Musa balbisiana]